MTNATNSNGQDLRPLVRVNYFAGALLSADDFRAEQDYFCTRLNRHNRSLHGSGIVTGLGVTEAGGSVQVAPGLALDCAGQEITLPTDVTLALPTDCEALFVTIRYAEVEEQPVPVVGSGEATTAMARVRESFVAELIAPRLLGLGPHGSHGRAWRACGVPHALPVARLLCRAGAWVVDKRFRPGRCGPG